MPSFRRYLKPPCADAEVANMVLREEVLPLMALAPNNLEVRMTRVGG